MAEILGTVSSAIAVAEAGLKVGGTLLKLRELWKEVQYVPQKIQDIMSQMDILEPILADIERHLQGNLIHGSDAQVKVGTSAQSNASIRTRTASYCREAFHDLQGLVKELSLQINSAKGTRRGIGKLKVVLRKHDLNRFQSRLERVFWLLQLALTSQQFAKLDYLT